MESNKIQNKALEIRYRENPKDKIYTPEDLAKDLIKRIEHKLKCNSVVLDPAKGTGAFYNNFGNVLSIGYDIDEGYDFFKHESPVDWIITNPPYSILNDWLEHSCKIARKGFAYLIGSYSLTPKRLQMIERAGFKMTQMHMFKVSQWFGMSVFVVFEKIEGWESTEQLQEIQFTYDRKVWK